MHFFFCKQMTNKTKVNRITRQNHVINLDHKNGRPTKHEQIYIERKLRPYFENSISARVTAGETGFNLKTVTKYFNQWKKEIIESETPDFLKRCKFHFQPVLLLPEVERDLFLILYHFRVDPFGELLYLVFCHRNLLNSYAARSHERFGTIHLGIGGLPSRPLRSSVIGHRVNRDSPVGSSQSPTMVAQSDAEDPALDTQNPPTSAPKTTTAPANPRLHHPQLRHPKSMTYHPTYP